jgi:hypothetical protein
MSFKEADTVGKHHIPDGVLKGFIPLATPYRIKLYTKCPNRMFFTQEATPAMCPEEAILSDMIKYAFLRHSMKPVGSRPPGWKAFVNYVDKFRVRHTRLFGNELANYYKESEWILVRLQRWYYDYYLPYYAIPGHVNVPIILGINDAVYYRDYLDIVTVSDSVKVFDFEYNKQHPVALGLRILNDIEVMVRVWGCWKFSSVKIEKYVRIFLSDKGVQAKEVTITDDYLKKAQITIGHIVDGIAHHVYYPAYSEQCARCSFKKKCRLV